MFSRLPYALFGIQHLHSMTYKGIDINNFDQVLASSSSSSTILNYIATKKFNAVNLYDLSTVFGSSTLKAKLPAFIKNLRSRGVITVGAIRSKYSSFKQTIDYCRSQGDPGAWFNELNLEKEYWNGNGTFSQWLAELDSTVSYLNSLALRAKFLMTAYIGWMEAGQYDIQGLEMVRRLDRLQVHDYRVKPDEPYTRTRLTALSKGAHQLSKTMTIIPLFSAEPNFLGPYLSTHTCQQVIDSYMAAYNTDTLIPYKQNLSLIGPHWFDSELLLQHPNA